RIRVWRVAQSPDIKQTVAAGRIRQWPKGARIATVGNHRHRQLWVAFPQQIAVQTGNRDRLVKTTGIADLPTNHGKPLKPKGSLFCRIDVQVTHSAVLPDAQIV